MKTLKLMLLVLFCSLCSIAGAQTVTVKPNPNGKINEFSPWETLAVKGADGSTANIEFRLKLEKRMGVSCHYIIEVKNSSTDKIDVVVIGTYYDKLVKGNFKEEKKSTLKPGKTFSHKVMTQGCKKDKGVEADDYGHCMNCTFELTVIATK